jgi:hypothetical protein
MFFIINIFLFQIFFSQINSSLFNLTQIRIPTNSSIIDDLILKLITTVMNSAKSLEYLPGVSGECNRKLDRSFFIIDKTIYRREETKKLEVPVIRGAVPEIAVDNLANYVVENQSFFLYIGTTIDPNSREIEKDLIDYFKKRDISKNMVYLNLSDTNSEEFFKDFNKNYVKIDNIKVDNYPAFIIFKDGVVLDKVQKEGNIKLGVGDIDRLLDEYSY